MPGESEGHAIEIESPSQAAERRPEEEAIYWRKRKVRAFGYLIVYPVLTGIVIGACIGGMNGGFIGAFGGMVVGSFLAFWFCSKAGCTAEDSDDVAEGVTQVHDTITAIVDTLGSCCFGDCGDGDGDGDGGDCGDGGGD